METYCLTVGELPSHNTKFRVYATLGTNDQLPSGCSSPNRCYSVADGSGLNGLGSYDITTPSVGGDKRHNNVSPCMAAYVWKRIA